MKKVHKLILKAERIKKNAYRIGVGIVSQYNNKWRCSCTRYNSSGTADHITKEQDFPTMNEAISCAYSFLGKEAPVIVIDI